MRCPVLGQHLNSTSIGLLGPTLMPHFNLITSLKAKELQIRPYAEVLGVRAPTYELAGGQGTQFRP